LRHEIERSRRDCERLTGTVPDAFAYPFGELNEEVVASVRDAGFALACTSEPGLAWVDGEALTTPRIGVGDWSASRLRAYLRWYWFA
jgi:peptidoglycan/xylan/chitin deacetylase (PgdA/CDA1 family)